MGAIETAMKDARLIDWLRSTAASAGRVASICTGAFLLGETGLLAGRRATTHWSVADRLAKMSPTTRVDANALYIEDGHIWTSAGVSAGIDLALALVARDLGPQTALKVAREIGRASGGERVGQYVEVSGVAATLKKKKNQK